MNDLEISKALALAIGHKVAYVTALGEVTHKCGCK